MHLTDRHLDRIEGELRSSFAGGPSTHDLTCLIQQARRGNLLLRILASRSWRNGGLQDLAKKVLRGHEITRGDTDLTEKDWEKIR